MSVSGLIEALQEHLAHGGNPVAEVVTYDPEEGKAMPVTGFFSDQNEVELDTDPER